MKRSKFNLSHTKLFSLDLGELVPCGLVEVLPGDTVQHATSALVRAAPLLAPVMHPIDVRIHHWFVPNRLVWTNWESFITGGPDGLNASVFPTIAMPGGGGAAVGSLADYLGVPTGVNSLSVSALPFRAYALIWNEYYRDQDLETALTVSKADGVDATTNTALQNCDWEKDYFTSSRPWEQKGPAITVPIGSLAPVVQSGDGIPIFRNTVNASRNGPFVTANADPGAVSMDFDSAPGGTGSVKWGNTNAEIKLQADLSSASAVTVNALRSALALQRFEEARARYGSRYVEYLRYLGVRSSDARLQRPEYLGGGRQRIQFSEVLQTSAAAGGSPLGELGGHGIAGLRSNRYRRFFEEHGYVISLISVRPKTIYSQGLFKTWNRRAKEDFFQRELQHIGQQIVKNKEVYAAHATPEGTFGFQDRYDEYRRMESQVAGEFRSSTLDFWHFARKFAADPALNATFVKCVPTEVPFAVPAEDVVYVMAKHSIQARRLLSAAGTSSIS